MVGIKTLVVVDMQNDFVTGTFGTPEARAIVPKVTEKMMNYIDDEKNYTNIVCTQDTHFAESYDANAEGELPEHCFVGTPGYEFVNEIAELVEQYPEEIKTINKFTFGSIKTASTIKEYLDYLLESLREEGVKLSNIYTSIEVVGLCTDICVISNALVLKAMMPYVTIVVDTKCCAGTTPENHKKALEIMELNGIKVIR